jgi:hypothetical protein
MQLTLPAIQPGPVSISTLMQPNAIANCNVEQKNSLH